MFDIDRELDAIRNIRVSPSPKLLQTTVKRAMLRQKKRKQPAEVRRTWTRRLSWAAAPAAAALILLFVVNITSFQSSAYYSLDINPGIGFSVNGKGFVTDVDLIDPASLDKDAILRLKGLPLEQAVDAALAEAQDDGYLKSGTDVLIACYANARHTRITRGQIQSSVSSNIADSVRLLYLSGSQKERRAAKTQGVSPGLVSLGGLAQNVSVLPGSDLANIIAEVEQKTGRTVEDLLAEKSGPVVYAAPVLSVSLSQATAVFSWDYIDYRKNNYDGTIIYRLVCAESEDALLSAPVVLDETRFEAWDKQPLDYTLALTGEHKDRYFAVFAVYDDGTTAVSDAPVYIPNP